MSRIKDYFQFAVIMAIYYFYRVTTAVTLPNRPVMTFFFWKNEKELIERNTMLFIISLLVMAIWLIFGVKWMLISVAVLVGVIGVMSIYQLIKMIRNGRTKK